MSVIVGAPTARREVKGRVYIRSAITWLLVSYEIKILSAGSKVVESPVGRHYVGDFSSPK